MTFSHTAIYVQNLEKSLNFYEKVLGLAVTRRLGEAGPVFLGVEGQPQLELIVAPQPVGFSGFFIGFVVPKLEEATKKLEAAGFPKTKGPISPNPKTEFSFFRGPDGEEVQLIEYK
ncbi:MAG: VOC family protein [Spirochaetes bacterium]|nr:VOC family protein [Spirochaetota bacterium]